MTKREHDVLMFVRKFIGEKGYSPSYQEIADGIGLSSMSGVSLYADRLIEMGLLMRERTGGRGLVLPLSPDYERGYQDGLRASRNGK